MTLKKERSHFLLENVATLSHSLSFSIYLSLSVLKTHIVAIFRVRLVNLINGVLTPNGLCKANI